MLCKSQFVCLIVSSSKAYEKIAIKRPLGSLVGFVNVSSIMFQIIMVAISQILMIVVLTKQNWLDKRQNRYQNSRREIQIKNV